MLLRAVRRSLRAAAMTHSDRAFHALAQHDPAVVLAVLRTLCPRELLGATPVRLDDLVPTRLDALAPPLDADWLARVGADTLLHLECQGYRDPGFAERLFRYHLLLTLRHPERLVRTIALWLTAPPPAQRLEMLVRGDVTVRVAHVVLAEVPAAVLLARDDTVCFAPGADAGAMSDRALCDAVARTLATTKASWYQRHMAVVTAHTQGRYDIMTHAMSDAGIEPVIIEDILRIGEDRGIAKGITRGVAQGIAQSVLALADARGLTLTDSQRAYIAQCADAEVLDAWLRRAITASSADEIFSATRAT